jgi:hypothetical protein
MIRDKKYLNQILSFFSEKINVLETEIIGQSKGLEKFLLLFDKEKFIVISTIGYLETEDIDEISKLCRKFIKSKEIKDSNEM